MSAREQPMSPDVTGDDEENPPVTGAPPVVINATGGLTIKKPGSGA